MKLTEMPDLLGTSYDALRQAIHRDASPAGRSRTLVPAPFTYPGASGPWHDPRVVQRWWTRRPGHGPGRGHTAP